MSVRAVNLDLLARPVEVGGVDCEPEGNPENPILLN